jgi:hypothetical protein
VTRMILIAVFLLVTIVSASAYVDPGTGSIIFSVIAAAISGAGVFVGVMWRKLFKKHRAPDPDDEPVAKSKSDD